MVLSDSECLMSSTFAPSELVGGHGMVGGRSRASCSHAWRVSVALDNVHV